MVNSIVEENALQGTSREIWDAPATKNGAGETLIEGFATDFSINHGEHVDFKINVNAAPGADVPYHIEIYRLGYYDGDGGRLVYTSGQLTGEAQPDPLYDPATGLVDAGNWSVSTGWDVPADAVSGVYLVKLVRDDNGATNQIPFIVRNDDGPKSDVVLQTSDTTWHAYNGWGGNNGEVGGNFYGDPSGRIDHPDVPDPGIGAQDRAYAVSYNRPFLTRDFGGAASGPQDYLFGADYAAIYWLEKNGYDVSYISGVDTDRLGEDYLIGHKAFISVGHDEYWSGQQRANVEAARDAGVSLLFWSGNEVYWKTRFEDAISADGTPYRTLVSYKETWANGDPNAGPEDYANIDPANDWTGTWRDMRFVDAVDAQGNHIAGGSRVVTIAGTLSTCGCITGASPENMLTGQLFGPDGTGQFGAALDVPAALAGLRFWRDTSVAEAGQLGIAPGILGYEWDTSPSDEYRPAGLLKLSETVDIPWNAIVIDQGNTAPSGTANHSLSLYRDESGALVFGAGTVFWSWGLSDQHDSSPYGATIENVALQQFTVNMFADMGIQPGVADAVLASQGLVRAVGITDNVAATTTISAPGNVHALQTVVITGTATDNDGNPLTTDDGKVAVVEVSVDGGATWRIAEGTTNWSYFWRPAAEGTYTILARAIDDSLNIASIVPAQTSVTVDAPVIPSGGLSLFDSLPAVGAMLLNDDLPIEVGMRFSTDRDGQITELRYFRAAADANDNDIREGHLWAPDGTLLASAIFISLPGESGWQVAPLDAPVAITAGVEYVVSYRTQNHYVSTVQFFNPSNEVAFDGLDDDAFTDPFGILSAPESTVTGDEGFGGNGVYTYATSLVMPNETYRAENYWVDVTFDPTDGSNEAPTITSNSGFTVEENQTAVATVTATDPDGDTIHYSIVGGADAAKFTVNLTTGVLTFLAAPNFEAPGDADRNNVYQVAVRASDGIDQATQSLAVTVADVSEPLPDTFSLFDPSAPVNTAVFNEGQTVELGMRFTADQSGQITELKYYRGAGDANDTDVREGHLWGPDGTLLATATFTSVPGEDGWQVASLSAPVTITAGLDYVVSYRTQNNYVATGGFFNPANEVAFDGVDDNAFSDPYGILSAPESTVVGAGGFGGNGVYSVGTALVMPDATYNATNYWVDVTFNPHDGPNEAPTITSNSGFTVEENQTAIATVTATDPDGDTIHYSIVGGADAAKFTINLTTGVLTFLAAPNFEAPGDADGDNVYQVAVRASDGIDQATQSLAVTVADVSEPLPDTFSLFDPSAPVNTAVFNEGQTVELGMRFTADQSGQITELKYYRGAGDANDTDVREGHLWGPDGTLLATATFTSVPGEDGWQVASLSAPVTITAGLDYVVSYRTQNNYVATGGFFNPANEVAFDGVDDNAFSDPYGILSAPESTVVGAGGFGGNGVYSVGTALVMPDATYNATNYWVDVTFNPHDGPNEAPTITSNSGFTVEENQTAIATVTATDPDGDTIHYSIVGGADAAKFTVNLTTGVLTFLAAPNFEAPGDADGDNVYQVAVRASDGIDQATQSLAVTVADVSEPLPDTFSLFDPSAPVNTAVFNEGQTVELGMRFTADQSGQITELKYYRGAGDANDTDVREGHLWGPDGTLLATATFTSVPGEDGWQVASLSAPVTITAGLDYVVSYRTQNNYVATGGFFNPANEVAFDGVDDNAFSDPYGILSAPESTVVGAGGFGGNGVYSVGTALVMPDATYNATNYWVDVTFNPDDFLL